MTVLYILLALVVLLVMITVHELGHYVAGKIFGFKINEFSIGFGPAIYKRTKKDGEIFAIRALPLGGYCAFEGEDEEGKDKPDSFNNRPAWKRLIVLLSGVTFNFLFGILTGAIYLFVTGYATPYITTSMNTSQVTGSGVQAKDIIVAVDGKTIENYRTFDSLIASYKEGDTFTLTVNRDGKIIDVTSSKQKYPAHYSVLSNAEFDGKIFDAEGKAIDIYTFSDEIAHLPVNAEEGDAVGTGVALETYLSGIYKADGTAYTLDEAKTFVQNGAIVYVKEGVGVGITYAHNFEKYGFFESIGKAWPFCFYLCDTILDALGGLFTGATSVNDMGGTITAVSQIAEISQMGLGYFLLLLPLLAMNLALFNVLPIPSLDGARCIFVIIEMIFRKPVPRKIEGWIHTIGLFLLLGLVIFFDINHFIVSAKLLL